MTSIETAKTLANQHHTGDSRPLKLRRIRRVRRQLSTADNSAGDNKVYSQSKVKDYLPVQLSHSQEKWLKRGLRLGGAIDRFCIGLRNHKS